ncbi:hypothetical protein BJG94_19445 [Rhizobium sp. Td3]|nr:hypothetical protein BJG94_19445 [Rhizobium sp. Td3]
MVRLSASRDDLSLGCGVFDRNPFIFSLASLTVRRILLDVVMVTHWPRHRSDIKEFSSRVRLFGGKCTDSRSSHLSGNNSRNVVKK